MFIWSNVQMIKCAIGQMMNKIIHVQGVDIQLFEIHEPDYISLTDMVKNFGDSQLIYNWMKNRSTLEYLGAWEQLYNFNFSNEGSVYANETDMFNLALFGKTAREWKADNPEAKGNMRDNATAEQLLVLANLENLNAEFIKQGL